MFTSLFVNNFMTASTEDGKQCLTDACQKALMVEYVAHLILLGFAMNAVPSLINGFSPQWKGAIIGFTVASLLPPAVAKIASLTPTWFRINFDCAGAKN